MFHISILLDPQALKLHQSIYLWMPGTSIYTRAGLLFWPALCKKPTFENFLRKSQENSPFFSMKISKKITLKNRFLLRNLGKFQAILTKYSKIDFPPKNPKKAENLKKIAKFRYRHFFAKKSKNRKNPVLDIFRKKSKSPKNRPNFSDIL